MHMYVIRANLSFVYALMSDHLQAMILLSVPALAASWELRLVWESAGALRSCQQAFAWQRALARCMLDTADWATMLGEQCRVLADMLSSGSTSRYAPHLHINTRLVLAVGGYQTSMRSQQEGHAVLLWLQGCVEVPALPCSLSSKHFKAYIARFVKSTKLQHITLLGLTKL